jgi:hypothetical protein
MWDKVYASIKELEYIDEMDISLLSFEKVCLSDNDANSV